MMSSKKYYPKAGDVCEWGGFDVLIVGSAIYMQDYDTKRRVHYFFMTTYGHIRNSTIEHFKLIHRP
jgi:hypothetical protein